MSTTVRPEDVLTDINGSLQIRGSADLARELVRAAIELERVPAFLEAAGCALFRSPLRVERLFVSIKALHPVFRARTYVWRHETDHVTSVEWPHGLENRPGYYDSPDHFVHRTGSELHVRRPGEDGEHACDLYGTLRTQGHTDYLIVPLRFSDGTVNTLSIATKVRNGFRERDLDWFRRNVPLFTVILERHAALEALDAVLATYLGENVSEQIRGGRIRPGDGELIEAGILIADLHDFTRHAARLGPTDSVRLLNSYFDCLVDPITKHGGHVIKFMGDAVLAFFPILQDVAAPTPLPAVLAIRQRLAALNDARARASQMPLRHSLCLHYGRILYGNIGSSDRFDFTIIGDAVNLTARAVDAAKKLGVEYLFTAAFADRFGRAGLTPCGRHALRGVQQPLEMFTFGDVTPRTPAASKP